MSQLLAECPVCKKPLQNGQDVVTCPDCGAKYHRDCYSQNGQCQFSQQHGKGFEYTPHTQQKAQEPKADKSGGVLCKNCQTVNEAENIFCQHCGAPLHTHVRSAAFGGGQSPPFAPPNPFAGGGQGPQAPNFAPWPLGPTARQSGKIGGISTEEWGMFVGKSSIFYLPRLAAMEARNFKVSFMFSAFFISPAFFAHRKMWGWAVASLLATFLLLIPQLLLIATAQGLALPFALPFALSLETLETFAAAANYIDLAMRLLFGMFGLFLYRGFASKKMAELRKKHAQDKDYYFALAKEGGTSALGAGLVVLAFFAVSFIISYYMGSALQEYFYPNLFNF